VFICTIIIKGNVMFELQVPALGTMVQCLCFKAHATASFLVLMTNSSIWAGIYTITQ
jgi:hypothetical protein